jgi:hypothetical protein
VELKFATELDAAIARKPSNYKVMSWDIVRSSSYGSKRYNIKELNIRQVVLLNDGNTVQLQLDDIKPVDIMTIQFDIKDRLGISLQGTVQNTIHKLKNN